jgi:uncharacterized membrane protein YgdD (TMEM256/DUF423 family)
LNARQTLLFASGSGLVVVALGAFGAHGLAAVLGERVPTWETAVQYQMFHTLALLALGLLMQAGQAQAVWLQRAALAFALGILLFSGSLYLLALSGIRWLGMITPLGGVAFLSGWLALVRGIYSQQ